MPTNFKASRRQSHCGLACCGGKTSSPPAITAAKMITGLATRLCPPIFCWGGGGGGADNDDNWTPDCIDNSIPSHPPQCNRRRRQLQLQRSSHKDKSMQQTTSNKQWAKADGETVLIVTSNDNQLQEEAITTGGERHNDNDDHNDNERWVPAGQPVSMTAATC